MFLLLTSGEKSRWIGVPWKMEKWPNFSRSSSVWLLITQFFSSTEREKQITVPLLLSSFRVFVSFAIRRADLYLDCLFIRYPQIVFKAISDSHSRPASFFFFPSHQFFLFCLETLFGRRHGADPHLDTLQVGTYATRSPCLPSPSDDVYVYDHCRPFELVFILLAKAKECQREWERAQQFQAFWFILFIL